MEVTGICTNVSTYKSGSNSRGEWSIQYITLKGHHAQYKVAVWNRPDLSSTKGKIVTVSGCEPGQDKEGKDIFELKGGAGKIEAGDAPNRTTQQSASKAVAAGKYERPTRDEYENILVRAIGTVYATFKQLVGAADVDLGAVAHVVNGYMVGYSKGDFIVVDEPKQEERKAPPADEDIPL